jgi:polyribonucleotide nucleotidyltransferase
MKRVSQEIKIGDKLLKLETGYLAQQANAAVLARLGDTMVLSTVVSSLHQEELDYFPLGVEYVERLYAGGRIKGSRWVKREGRPSDEAILTARLIDRSIRPLFNRGYKCRVQVIITVLSVDAENSPDIPAICATSAALAASDIPWGGPIGAIRLGFVPKNSKQSFILNPTYQDLEYSEMDVILSGTKEALVMIEGRAREVTEENFIASLGFALKEIKKLILSIEEFAQKVKVKKQSFEELGTNHELIKQVKKELGKDLEKAVVDSSLHQEGVSLNELEEALFERFPEEKRSQVKAAMDELVKKIVRDQILKKRKRIDGRGPSEIRPLEIEVGVLPRTHGSAMFKRGNTQALTVATLGSPSLEQLIESMEGEETKRYIHHYYTPPFSFGETGRLGWPSRREIGHGALAERAFEPVVPSEEKFPYTIRLVSEIMSSNGSTSMASVCGSTLSLMDAGVPIKAPVAGIAMGLVSDGKKHVILSDILGLEDFHGDMDFKVAGTKQGISAVQMDVKNTQIPPGVLEEVFKQAKEGRLYILEKMLEVLPVSRSQVSEFAPKIEVLHIPVEKIGEVIGPGGRMIRKIINETGAAVDIEDDGSVNISSPDKESVEKAVAMIKGITREVKVGEELEGTVKRIQPFGAFVEIAPGRDGLVHVSRMATRFVKDPNEIVKIGQKVKVRVVEVEAGRISLSMLPKEQKRMERTSRPRGRLPKTSFSPRRDSRRDSSRRGPPRGRSRFPTSSHRR